MILQSSLDFRTLFEKKKPVSFVNANLTSKIGKAIRYAPIFYRCHGVNIGATQFSLLHGGHIVSVSTQPQIGMCWRKGAFPEEKEAWPEDAKHCHRARKLIARGGMHPLIHMHS